ncbi:uncharacterized protein J4E87_004269 [Alternaria ethzedia]|uniref:uncharacterized protein n=1 Tax=Alternaria ethzedia TaxID=181014 RepID=UPI0020C28646|nr:uncharacterized protein J4E87_004269 [Alternaria ethzedia]KAI4626928.1 hypothetical protein J4E87_004269 [Alternaria ethzedia]
MWLLRSLGERMNATRTVKEFWIRVLEGLNHNEYDVPFALLYTVTEADDIENGSSHSDATPTSVKSCVFEGSIGVPRGHAVSPDKFSFKNYDGILTPAFRAATQTLEPRMLSIKDHTLPQPLLDIIEWRGYKDPCREAIVLPLRPTNADNVCALSFIAMLNRQIATSLASVLLFEGEVRQSKEVAKMATLQREQMSRQLQLQTGRMRRMTELSPMGMYLFNPDGLLLEANEKYYEMTGVSPTGTKLPWTIEMMVGESKQVAQDMWNYMITHHKPASRELQFANSTFQPRDIDGSLIEYWVLSASQPELSPDGELISIMGSLTDISHLKWAQGLQERRLREAEEAKRQQNEFIDITSHEMRNPLSAILICADDIKDTLTHYKFSCTGDQKMAQDCIEAAENIALCVQHQKSIVDDILTVSKLDSNLLRITPIPAQPIIVVQRSMAMFRPEIQAKNIDFKFVPHQSIRDLEIDWVILDPSRLLQIIVNLITNAIKFTMDAPVRSITVHVCAHAESPDFGVPEGFQFVPPRQIVSEFGNGEGWGSGSFVYLRFNVQDTGCGLSPQQISLLFEKFAQAADEMFNLKSPRTHMQYGGSGLGLFISRQLAELHGGQIGVSSQAGVGSTFGFYLKCKRMIAKKPTISTDTVKHALDAEHAASSRKISAAAANQNSTAPAATPKEVETPVQAQIPRPTNDKKDEEKDDRLHVLVVEDNLVNQKVLVKQLTKAGCVTHTADNGVWALKQLAKTKFCDADGMPLTIILMDCEMPEMDGLTCCRKIREMEERKEITKHVPIIAVTANIRGGQMDDAKEAGMDDVVGKPFRIPDLLAKMKALLKKLED